MESKSFLLVSGFTLLNMLSFSQPEETLEKTNPFFASNNSSFECAAIDKITEATFFMPIKDGKHNAALPLKFNTGSNNFFYKEKYTLPKSENSMLLCQSQLFNQPDKIKLNMDTKDNNFFLNNRRNRYSALWAFTSLNYLYADLVGLMDKNILNQYQNGVVDGTRITPTFLTAAAGLMQIPLSNVFLPQVIKNERTLKWVQIASGLIMTLVQSGTLFLGTPTPYYMIFSAIEIGTTAYITFDAIKWKAPKKAIIE